LTQQGKFPAARRGNIFHSRAGNHHRQIAFLYS
jgi:hypothetical protein